MTNGPSRELLELWAPDSRNGVILTGYSIEGTLARVSVFAVLRRVWFGSVLRFVLYILPRMNVLFFLPQPSQTV